MCVPTHDLVMTTSWVLVVGSAIGEKVTGRSRGNVEGVEPAVGGRGGEARKRERDRETERQREKRERRGRKRENREEERDEGARGE